MADEAGAGAADRASGVPGYTLVSEGHPASISGNVVALRFFGSSSGAATIKFAFFTASGDNLTTVAGSITSIVIGALAEGVQEFTAPTDFTAFAVTAGDYLGLYTPSETSQDYAGSEGAGIWYYNGDGSDSDARAFSLGDAWLDALSADIVAAGGGTVVPQIMSDYRRRRS